MLEFKPESIGSLKKRYPAALEKIWIPDAEMSDRPGLRRENVFDGENGLRLIISKERANAVTTVIHFSGSVDDNLRKPASPLLPLILQEFVTQFREISGDHKSIIRMHMISDGGIPHFIIL